MPDKRGYIDIEQEGHEIKELLCKAVRAADINAGFGEPFLTAFASFNGNADKRIIAAAYACSLFLSCIINKFPTERLRTFMNAAREEYGRFIFNCKAYEEIYSRIERRNSDETPLLDKDGNCEFRCLSKNDFFEALDFYTNQ